MGIKIRRGKIMANFIKYGTIVAISLATVATVARVPAIKKIVTGAA